MKSLCLAAAALFCATQAFAQGVIQPANSVSSTTVEIVVVVPQAPATDRNTPDGFFDPGADEVTSNLEQSGNRDGVNQIDRSNSDRNSDKFVGTGGFLALQNASVVDHDIGQKPVTKPKRTYVLRDGRLESVVDNVPTGYTEPVSLKR